MANGSGYVVVSQRHVNQWDESRQIAIPGWEITVHDDATGVKVPVFVPDTHYGPEQAETLIAHTLERVRAVHSLGQG